MYFKATIRCDIQCISYRNFNALQMVAVGFTFVATKQYLTLFGQFDHNA